MKENAYKPSDWLPTSVKEVRARGWDQLDVILFTGDAYIDHPSFGAAVVGRLLEAEGYRVAIVPQPNWRDDLRDFTKLGTRIINKAAHTLHNFVHIMRRNICCHTYCDT